jgi:hypothetical protein
VASDAAAALLQHGALADVDTRGAAVAALEQGRTVLLARDLSYHRETALLRDRHPRLLTELVAVREALDAGFPDEPDGDTTDERFRLAARWESVLAEIRGKRGFRGFMAPPDPDELVAAAAGRTVVVVNVSRFRCDALLLGDGGITVVPLAGLDLETAQAKAETFGAALRAAETADDVAGRDAAERRISAVLHWLWRTVAEPVLAALPARPGDRPGRLWWMPTGPLTSLPMHAAATEDGRSSVLARYVSSYVPSLRSLLDSGATPEPLPAGGLAAALVAPQVAGMAALPAAGAEAAVVATRFPGAVLRSYPGEQEALQIVRTSAWLHLACHAAPQPGAVPEWALLLGEATLGVGEVARSRAAGGRLAFLSACETAVGDPALADESLTLASAFRAAGYRHVIATLWTVNDRAMSRLVRDFYRSLPAGGPADAAESSARVLHDAVSRARRRRPDRPSAWAPFVHVGP